MTSSAKIAATTRKLVGDGYSHAYALRTAATPAPTYRAGHSGSPPRRAAQQPDSGEGCTDKSDQHRDVKPRGRPARRGDRLVQNQEHGPRRCCNGQHALEDGRKTPPAPAKSRPRQIEPQEQRDRTHGARDAHVRVALACAERSLTAAVGRLRRRRRRPAAEERDRRSAARHRVRPLPGANHEDQRRGDGDHAGQQPSSAAQRHARTPVRDKRLNQDDQQRRRQPEEDAGDESGARGAPGSGRWFSRSAWPIEWWRSTCFGSRI